MSQGSSSGLKNAAAKWLVLVTTTSGACCTSSRMGSLLCNSSSDPSSKRVGLLQRSPRLGSAPEIDTAVFPRSALSTVPRRTKRRRWTYLGFDPVMSRNLRPYIYRGFLTPLTRGSLKQSRVLAQGFGGNRNRTKRRPRGALLVTALLEIVDLRLKPLISWLSTDSPVRRKRCWRSLLAQAHQET